MVRVEWTSEERGHLNALVERPAEHGRRLVYAQWLRKAGQSDRAAILEETVRVARGGPAETLSTQIRGLESQDQGWSRMVGARLVAAMVEHGQRSAIERWLPLARPAIQWRVGSLLDEPANLSSRMWGDPALSPEQPWPTRVDCKHWETVPLADDLPCRFVAQINLSELHGSPVAAALPDHGLLSFFCHSEFDVHGTASVCLHYQTDLHSLARVPHPPADGSNARLDPHAIEFVEALTLPEHGGPWAEALGIGGRDFATMDALSRINNASGGGSYGLLGHMTATTSEDPTPGQDWVRLAWIPAEPDECLLLHLAIQGDALRTSAFSRFEFAWVDFDGG